MVRIVLVPMKNTDCKLNRFFDLKLFYQKYLFVHLHLIQVIYRLLLLKNKDYLVYYQQKQHHPFGIYARNRVLFFLRLSSSVLFHKRCLLKQEHLKNYNHLLSFLYKRALRLLLKTNHHYLILLNYHRSKRLLRWI